MPSLCRHAPRLASVHYHQRGCRETPGGLVKTERDNENTKKMIKQKHEDEDWKSEGDDEKPISAKRAKIEDNDKKSVL